MNKIKFHITILFILIWNSLFSQQYTNYSTKNGLPSNHVYRITQDVKGFIWFITDKGMVKYNGTDFKTYTIRDGLPTNDIWNIVATPNGKVWYFSKSPKIGYIEKDSIYSFPSAIKGEILSPSNRNIVGNDISFNNSINHYELENGEWKGKEIYGGYSVLKQYRTFLRHDKLKRLQFSKSKSDFLFIDKNNDTIKKIKINQEIIISHTRGQVNDSIYIWLSKKSYSILNLNNYKLKTTFFKDAINIEKSKYVRMHVVNKQIQITGTGFVFVLDKNYDLVKKRYIPTNLKAHFSFIDKQDNLWIATFRNGVYKLPKSKQNAIYTLINEKVGGIKIIDNKLLTTVLDKGFYVYDSITKQFKPYIKNTDFTYGVFNIKELNKNYFITHNSIFYKKNNVKNIIENDLRSNLNETARQLVYHKNYLYGNFTAGLNKLNPKDLSIEKIYTLNGIRTFTSFKNKLIIATSSGLQILTKDSIKPFEFKKIIQNDLHKKPILSLTKINDKSLLVGTDAYGAFITNLENITPLKETEYLSINDSFIENNNLWLATDIGVLHYKKDIDDDFIFVTTYNENDGLLLKNAKSIYVNKDELIVSSNIGAVTIPKKKSNYKSLLDIYISTAKYNDKSISLDNKVRYTKNNTVNFNISNIDFSENSNFLYEYQLLPIQKKWISTSSKYISFNNLQPNSYELRIKSKDKNNSVSFEILPLWYQTILAKIIFGLLLLSLLIGIILLVGKSELKKQTKKIQAQKKLADFELHALRSQMNPHFVFNSLNAIQYFITKNEIDLSEKYLVKFARLIRMFFNFSREKEITLDQEIKLLKGYLEIEKMRFGKDFKYKFNVDKKLNISKNTIPTMLLQPIVENAVNHGVFHNGGKGLIEISFNFINNKSYEIIITDDGVGVEKSKEIQKQSLKKAIKSTAKSTEVINERIELLNQSALWNVTYKLTDNSKITKGTSVQLTFRKNE